MTVVTSEVSGMQTRTLWSLREVFGVYRSQLRALSELSKSTNCSHQPDLRSFISTGDPENSLCKFGVQELRLSLSQRVCIYRSQEFCLDHIALDLIQFDLRMVPMNNRHLDANYSFLV
jgi:hypothetical protein